MKSGAKEQRAAGVATEAMTVRLDAQVMDRLRREAFDTRRSQSLIIEEALIRMWEAS